MTYYCFYSQIQNSYKLGLKRICVPYSNTNKHITLILLHEGLLQNVTTGDIHGPFRAGAANGLIALGSNNVSKARLWLDLKYRNGAPALGKMGVISKPSRRIFASPDECRYETLRVQ